MPKVSVIIPTYNRARLIPEAIESVLAQSFRDFEIIVVDDGSTDNTAQVVSGLPVKYLRQENQGAPAARNKGLKVAQGEYLTFLDSDDILMEDALGKRVEVLDRHPEVGFSYGRAYLMDEKGHIFGMTRSRSRHSYVREGREEIGELIFGNHIPCPTVMVRRSCLEEVGAFNADLRTSSEDFELWVRLAKRYGVAYIAQPLAKYRVHPHGASATVTAEDFERSGSLVLESIFSDREIGPLFSSQRPSAYCRFYLRLAGHAYSQRRMGIARHYLFRAMKTDSRFLLKSHARVWISLLIKTWTPEYVLQLGRRASQWRRTATSRQF